MKQITYNKCQECEFLKYWGYCTDSLSGEYCKDAVDNCTEEENENNKIA